jgi:hypothetical protein
MTFSGFGLANPNIPLREWNGNAMRSEFLIDGIAQFTLNALDAE